MRHISVISVVIVQLFFAGSIFASAPYKIPPSRAAVSMSMKGVLKFRTEDYRSSYNAYSSAISIMENEVPTPRFSLVRAHLGGGSSSLELQNVKKAEQHFINALLIVESSPLRESLLKVEVLMACASFYDRIKDNNKAVEFYEKAISSLYKETPAYWITLAATLDKYAAFIRRLPQGEGWFGLAEVSVSGTRNPSHLQKRACQLRKRAGLIRKRAEKEPYNPK